MKKSPADAAPASTLLLRTGLVVANFGRHCLVQDTESAQRTICHARGKKAQVVVGDRVQWLPSQDEGTIEQVLPRKNLLFRQDELRTKSFASNLDTVLVWLAAEPVFSEAQLTRALIACEDAGVSAVVVLNKRDLGVAFDEAWSRLAPYRAMGYAVIGTSLKGDATNASLASLTEALRGKTTLVLGPSGSGKSTFINAMLPHAAIQTQEISKALNSGKHTTTATTWYDLPKHQGAIIDSPGFQEFGLHHIAPKDLAQRMPDLRIHANDCKFYNCTHLHEPGCGVRDAVMQDGDFFDEELASSQRRITILRYAMYSNLHAQLSEQNRH